MIINGYYWLLMVINDYWWWCRRQYIQTQWDSFGFPGACPIASNPIFPAKASSFL